MNTVEPIRKKADITKMKKALRGRDQILFILGINTGLRISDLLNLKVKDVKTVKGTVKTSIQVQEVKTSNTKKNNKTRNIKLNKAVKDALKNVEYNEDAYLFPSRKGDKSITRVHAHRILSAAADRAGLEYAVGTHSLRKTWGYFAYKKNTPVPLIMKAFNHSSEEVTLRYIGILQDDIDDVYDAVTL